MFNSPQEKMDFILGKKMRTFRRGLETVEKNQMESLEMKNTISEILKCIGCINRFDTTKEIIHTCKTR